MSLIARGTARYRLVLPLVGLLGFGCEAPGDPSEVNEATAEWIELPLAENAFYDFDRELRSDTIEVVVPGGGEGLEVNLEMEEGEAIVYTWRAGGLRDPDLLLSEFHGHTESAPDEPGTVMFYRQATGSSENGALIAPFTGVHAWYFRNDSDAPVTITLEVSGFYRLEGETGL